ncbi:hypothetical protein A6X21_05940 [Planctopirus hydrillae]|uniref:Uncharacterized protein n=1 Tax=Planctopirus hydrillae TaxID=1841610 RepID=A0A1C3EBD0_9PLAN|nr:hypothetical protein A6X21_05940 [Planctopirus hydrillae]
MQAFFLSLHLPDEFDIWQATFDPSKFTLRHYPALDVPAIRVSAKCASTMWDFPIDQTALQWHPTCGIDRNLLE